MNKEEDPDKSRTFKWAESEQQKLTELAKAEGRTRGKEILFLVDRRRKELGLDAEG